MKKVSITKVLVIVWLVFTTLYLIYGEYSRLTNFVAQGAYNQGYQDSVTRLVGELGKCQPVPITLGTNTVNVISLECLQPGPGAPTADTTDVSTEQ